MGCDRRPARRRSVRLHCPSAAKSASSRVTFIGSRGDRGAVERGSCPYAVSSLAPPGRGRCCPPRRRSGFRPGRASAAARRKSHRSRVRRLNPSPSLPTTMASAPSSRTSLAGGTWGRHPARPPICCVCFRSSIVRLMLVTCATQHVFDRAGAGVADCRGYARRHGDRAAGCRAPPWPPPCGSACPGSAGPAGGPGSAATAVPGAAWRSARQSSHST